MIKFTFALLLIGSAAVMTAGQQSAYPNELEGFQFSKMDKLRDLTLMVSSKDDVIARFGKECVNGCVFNEDWEIGFAYINAGWSANKTENGLTTVMKPRADRVDKLADIVFRPRRAVLLSDDVVIPAGLRCGISDSTQGELKYKAKVCMDARGLIYVISTEANATAKLEKNQIIKIIYTRSEAQTNNLFVVTDVVPTEQRDGGSVSTEPRRPQR